MKNQILLCVTLFLSLTIFAQQKTVYKVVTLVPKENFYLNGGARAAVGGKSRMQIEVQLPMNTVGWYYSISTTPNQNQEAALNLTSQLVKLISPAVGIPGGLLSSLVVPTGSGVCDVYMMNDVNMVNNFIAKRGNITSIGSGSRENIRQGPVEIRDLLSGPCYLCVRNPSALEGINVTIEVAAVVREVVAN